MPNWCQNKAVIKHEDPSVIANLYSKIQEDNLLFKHIKPMPEGLENTVSPTDSPNWYDWSIKNWGTKWDACHMSADKQSDNSIVCNFDSAWSPPFGVYEELAERGFEVEAYFVEYGMMFAGEWYCDADGLRDDDYSDDISEYVPSGVDEVFGVTETLEEWKREEEFDIN